MIALLLMAYLSLALLSAFSLSFISTAAALTCETYTGLPASVSSRDQLQCAINQNISQIQITSNINNCATIDIIGKKGKKIAIFGLDSSVTLKGNSIDSIFKIENSMNVAFTNLTLGFNDLTIASSAQIQILVSSQRTFGAALNIVRSVVSVTNVKFVNCSADIGGGISVTTKSVLTVTNCIFEGNFGLYGSAIFSGVSKLKIFNSSFVNNSATQGTVGAISSNVLFQGNCVRKNRCAIGAGVYLNDVNATITGNYFMDNVCSDYVSFGSPGEGGAVFAELSRNVLMYNNKFLYNNASSGGAVYFRTVTNALSSGDEYTGNRADSGGAIQVFGASTTASKSGSGTINIYIQNATFRMNSATEAGGALTIQDNVKANILHCVFEDSFAKQSGGEIYSVSSHIVLRNSTFNHSRSLKGAHFYFTSRTDFEIYSCKIENGEGIKYVISAETGVSGLIEDTTFENNYCEEYGGAISVTDFETLMVRRSVFNRNSCDNYGGAFYLINTNLTVEASNFTHNLAKTSGGAIFGASCFVNISNSRFTYNTAYYNGGALNLNYQGALTSKNSIYSYNVAINGGAITSAGMEVDSFQDEYYLNQATTQGGAISFLGNVNATFVQTTIQNNYAVSGGGVYASSNTNAIFTDCTIEGNTAQYSAGAFALFLSTSFIFSGGSVKNNYARASGGAISLTYRCALNVYAAVWENNTALQYGGTAYCVDFSEMIFKNTNISNSSVSDSGGCLYLDQGSLIMIHTKLESNYAGSYGGAVYASRSKIKATMSNFARNGGNPDALYLRPVASNVNETFTGTGGLMYLDNSTFVSVGSTYAENKAGEGGVIFASQISAWTSISDVYRGNFALTGGCVAAEYSAIIIERSVFEYNTAAYNYGSVLFSNYNSIIIDSATIQKNVAVLGGAIYCAKSIGLVFDSFFFDNTASLNYTSDKVKKIININNCVDQPTTLCGNGAVFFFSDSAGVEGFLPVFIPNASFALKNNTFRSNRVLNSGGAISSLSYQYNITMSNNMFIDNSCGHQGGAVYSFHTNIHLVDNTFTNNRAKYAGGALYWIVDTINSESSFSIALDMALNGGFSTELYRAVDEVNSTYSGNTATYGGNHATNPVYLNATVTGIGSFNSNELNNKAKIIVDIADYYETNCLTSPLAVQISSIGNSVIRTSSTIEQGMGGNVSFTDLIVVGMPGQVATLLFEETGADYIHPKYLNVSINKCSPGSILNCLSYSSSGDSKVCIQAECINCVEGKYSFDTSDTSCKKCPPNSYCPGGDKVSTDSGYWRQSQYEVDPPLRCSYKGCLGGYSYSTQCADGYKWSLCSVCEDGWTSTSSNSCVQCTNRDYAFSTTALPIIAVVFVVVFILVFSFRESVKKIFNELLLKLKGVAKKLSPQLTVKIKILISFLQILVLSAGAFNINYPSSYANVLSFWTIFGFDFTKFIRCQFQTDFYFDLLVSTLAPFTLVIFVAVILGFRMLHANRLNSKNPYYTFENAKTDLLYTVLLLSYFTLSPTTTHIFEMIRPCHKLSSGEYMYADYSCKCGTPKYKSYLAYAYVMLFVYPLGIPLAYAYFLIKYRARINPKRREIVAESEADKLSEEFVESKKVKVRLTYPELEKISFLFDNYKARKWYFEVVDCLRRLGMASVPYLMKQRSLSQIMVVFCISLFMSAILMLLRPFSQESDNNLAILSQWAISLTVLCSIGLFVTNDDQDSSDHRTIGAIMIFVTIFVLIAGIYNIFESNKNASVDSLVQVDPNQQNDDDDNDDDDDGDDDDKDGDKVKEGESAVQRRIKMKKMKSHQKQTSDASIDGSGGTGRNNSVSGDVQNPMYINGMDESVVEMKDVYSHSGNSGNSVNDSSTTQKSQIKTNRFFAKRAQKTEDVDLEDSDDEV